MAIDVYLQIEGVKGESNDERHKDWIECTSATWSVLQPKSATASTGGGHTAERCEHGDLVITKLSDLSSPLCELMAKVSGLNTLRSSWKNVLIGAVVPSIQAKKILTEYVSLKYGKVKWKYTQQKVAGGWDLSANRIC